MAEKKGIDWIVGKRNELVERLDDEFSHPVEKKEKKNPKGWKAYTFNYHKYYGLDEISMAFALDWGNATKHLYRGHVEKNIAQYGEEYVDKIAELKEIEDKDAAVFLMIYVLNPNAPLCFKGTLYPDLKGLGNAMQAQIPNQDADIYHLLSSGCLKKYVDQMEYDETFKEAVSAITQKIMEKEDAFYFALMYLLCPELGFEYKGKQYASLESFVADLEKNEEEPLAKACGELVSDKLFLMWIYSLGYKKPVIDWMNTYEKAV